MGKVILYLALSLDGYIADENGGYEFLSKYSDSSTYDYDSFLSKLGSIIMGSISYDITVDASPKWPFGEFKTYVYSRKSHTSSDNIMFTNQAPSQLINEIKSSDDKDIWLYGGSQIIDTFINENLIDEYWLYYVPEVLGSDLLLFKVLFAAYKKDGVLPPPI